MVLDRNQIHYLQNCRQIDSVPGALIRLNRLITRRTIQNEAKSIDEMDCINSFKDKFQANNVNLGNNPLCMDITKLKHRHSFKARS
jgi:hypothetical protein